jgi:hypothetical protein
VQVLCCTGVQLRAEMGLFGACVVQRLWVCIGLL